MDIKLLDPTIDVIFKLLMLRNEELLRDMIEAVLPHLARDTLSLRILNPDIPREFPRDKAIALDIGVQLQNGYQIDLEMQSTVRPSTRARFLYYWAKGFAKALKKGDDYSSLRPCISILWFKKAILNSPRFHSIFRLSEEHSREIFATEIEIHVLELPNLALADEGRQAKL